MTKVAAATTRTNGTNTSLMRSARRWIGAFDPCARWTSSTIDASTLSRPTRTVRTTSVPATAIVAPMTGSPGPTSTGSGSPVSIDPSMEARPSTTTPSTGTFSPGRTRTRSPTRTASSGTSVSMPPSIRRAVRGWSPMSRRMAPRVWSLARDSSQRPSRTSPMMMVALSKYVSGSSPALSTIEGNRAMTTL